MVRHCLFAVERTDAHLADVVPPIMPTGSAVPSASTGDTITDAAFRSNDGGPASENGAPGFKTADVSPAAPPRQSLPGRADEHDESKALSVREVGEGQSVEQAAYSTSSRLGLQLEVVDGRTTIPAPDTATSESEPRASLAMQSWSNLLPVCDSRRGGGAVDTAAASYLSLGPPCSLVPTGDSSPVWTMTFSNPSLDLWKVLLGKEKCSADPGTQVLVLVPASAGLVRAARGALACTTYDSIHVYPGSPFQLVQLPV